MLKKVTVVGCILVTLFVVHTAIRIEHSNNKSGTFLPRPPGYEHEDWQVPELEMVMDYVQHQIAERRANSFMAENPGQELPPLSQLGSEPYNELEQSLFQRNKDLHAAHTELHWWVRNFGGLQWTLAPLAFVWSIGNFLTVRKGTVRVLSTSCALLAFGAIFLMIFRGY